MGYKQNHSNATYSLWRSQEDYFIDWSQSATQIKRFIDSVSFPYSGACTSINNITYRVLEGEVIDDVIISTPSSPVIEAALEVLDVVVSEVDNLYFKFCALAVIGN